jgi:outer membrane biosynthesis protein TonB
MSEQDRGAYAPPTADTPLSFDARQPVRGARPFPVTLIISGLVLVGLVVAIFFFYRSGVREAGQAPQAVGTPVGAIKSAAPPEAQPQDPAAGLQIYQTEQGRMAPLAPAQPTFTPQPEQPAPRPAPALVVPPAPPPPAPQAPALRPELPPAPPPAALPAVKAEAPPVKPVAKPAPKAAVEPAAPAAAHGGVAVQIGAVSSTALADKAWNEAIAAAPGLGAGKGKGLEKIDKDGHVLYRTTVTGFADKAQAAQFCTRLKAAGKACFVK